MHKRAALTRKDLQAEVKNSRSMKAEKEVIRERCIVSGVEYYVPSKQVMGTQAFLMQEIMLEDQPHDTAVSQCHQSLPL